MEKRRVQMKLVYKPEFERTSIGVLTVGNRSENILRRGNIMTLGQLMDNWDKLYDIKGCGVGCVKEIKNALISYYMSVSSDERQEQFLRSIKEVGYAEEDLVGVLP